MGQDWSALRREKDLEILILRKQLMIVEQRLAKPMPLSRAERLTLAVISTKLKMASGQSLKELREVINPKRSSSGIVS